MQDARVRWALAVVGLLIFAGSGITLYAKRQPAPPPLIITTSPSPVAPHPQAAPLSPAPPPHNHRVVQPLYVHVAGAVKRPSLYALPPGSRIMQAIKAAGGPAAKADLDAINLAEKVRDSEKVYVPVKQPQAVMIVPPGNAIGHTSVIPDGNNATPFQSASAPSSHVSTHPPHSGSAKADKLTSPSQGQVNLNTADAEQLQRLPGVGPAMSARILAYRAQAHGFHSVDELQGVSGIGPKKYAKIAPLVKLE